MTRLLRACSLLALAAGCGGDGVAEPPDAAPFDPLLGGTVAAPGCGYDVTTQAGATAPRLVAAGTTPLGPDPTPRQIHLGLAGDPATSRVILWRTADDATLATTVRYGRELAEEHEVDGITFQFMMGFSSKDGLGRMHEVHLCGLEPDTVYQYQVGGGGADGAAAWSEIASFRTAPASRDSEIVLLVLGDAREGYPTWGDLLSEAETVALPDLILFTGDVSRFGPMQEDWDAFFDQAEPILARVPMLLARGNHDAATIQLTAMSAMPDNEQWYSLDYGPAHLTVLDDTPDDPDTIEGAQKDFLAADLAANGDAPWLLVMHHRALWSASQHGSDTGLRGVWAPVFDDYGVDLVLNGHDHDYERSKPMVGDAVADGVPGTVYVVAGGAGAPLYDAGTGYWTEYSEKVAHFVQIAVSPTTVEGRAFRTGGTLMDAFTLAH